LSNALLPSLANQALDRLRKLADGNGIAPEKIALISAEENTYTLEGTLGLIPKNDIQRTRYPGGTRGGKGRKVLPDAASLQLEIQNIQGELEKGGKWVEDSIKELKATPGEGWGLDAAQITLPESAVVLAASETCPSCHGVRLLTCTQCHGQGYNTCAHCGGGRLEACPTCNGSGHNPSQPDQPCPACGGTRTAPCRFCHGVGQLPCPTCHGRKGVPCTGCKGTGQITEEVSFVPGAETYFKLLGEGLPSGLRRGLDRLGIANLSKGHADIETLPPKKDDEPRGNVRDEGKNKNYTAALSYQAKMPYADLKMNFNGRKAIVSVFGKRGTLLGVPAFLDDALEDSRAKLKQAVRGEVVFDAVLDARAIREALEIQLSGKGEAKELRRKYPVGLSQDVAREILTNIRLSLNRFTLRMRSLVAVVCGVLSALLFGAIFLTPVHEQLFGNMPPVIGTLFDIFLPVIVMTASWFGLTSAIRFALQRRFHNIPVSLNQKTGKTGYAMVASIAVFYAVIYAAAHLL